MLSVPTALVRYDIRDGEIVPHFLGTSDVPWLRDLLDTFTALVDEPRTEVEARLRRPPGRALFPIAVHLLWQIFAPSARAAVSPRRARAALFLAAAGAVGPEERQAAMRTAANWLGTEPASITESLFADLPGERCLTAPGVQHDRLGPDELALRCNTAILQALARRAISMHVVLTENTRAVVQQAKLRGLMCTVEGSIARGEPCALTLTGPLSLFARTTAYGHALADLIPTLAWCRTFRAELMCRLGSAQDRAHRLVLTHLSPIRPGREPRRYDSALEARFARDWQRATSEWVLGREPGPVEAAGKLIFPDFEVRHVRDPRRRWLLEIVGFWTPDYLAAKLAALRSARIQRLIVCVDRRRSCGAEALPDTAAVVWFGRSIDVGEILALVEGTRTSP